LVIVENTPAGTAPAVLVAAETTLSAASKAVSKAGTMVPAWKKCIAVSNEIVGAPATIAGRLETSFADKEGRGSQRKRSFP
jgi:hypothetical protein